MSLKKIAEMTGVSPSTVSRVLNNVSATCASKEVRDKIFEAAREIGYHPNENARKLRAASHAAPVKYHVSIVLARIKTLDTDPFFSELFRELEISLFENNIKIDHVVYAEDFLPRDISESHGVLILGRCSHKLLGQITAANCNVAAISRNSTNFNVDEILCDGKKAAELAMEHLISLGHRNIAYIGDCSYESRYIGYCNSLIRHDFPINYKWIKQTDQTKESADTAFCELMGQTTDFSAVFCANDISAIRILQILEEKKKEIKRNISVISIDNIEESQSVPPYLTTINIPRREMAHMAVLLLLDRMEKKHRETMRIEFPCRIVKRGSCYPYPARQPEG